MTDLITNTHHIAFVYGISPTLIIIMVVTALASWIVSSTLKRRFNEYSQIPIQFTGAQIAETMLRENGITDVKVIHTPGKLTDHYDPTNKTVNLSEEVYSMNSIAAAAVAAHECGHAVQHAKSYAWLTMRSKMVPAVQFAGNTLNIFLIASIVGASFFNTPAFLYVWVALFATTTLFAFVTLPVEFDASRRAKDQLLRLGLIEGQERSGVSKVLNAAAMTYVAAMVSSFFTLLHFVMIARGNDRD